MKRLIFLLIALLLRIEVIHGQTRKWMPMPQEVNGIVTSLAVYQGQLIVAGAFTKAGQVSVNKIAAWDGVKWSSLGSGMRGGLYSGVEGIYVHDSLLYVEGFFDSAGTVSAKGLAIWNGKEWKNPLKNGHLDTLRVIHSLIEYKNEIYAGGNYSQIGGIKANGIAKWDGMNWHSLGTNKYTDAQNLYVYNNELYMLGSLDLGGSITDYIGRWDGISWKKVSTGVGYQHKAMINWKGKLLIGAHTPHQIPPVDYRDIVEWNSDTIIRFSRQVMINLYNFHIFRKGALLFWRRRSYEVV